ncbi:MAG: hypothetical protein ACJ8FL_04200, partial [Sphingomicrobium sp.]
MLTDLVPLAAVGVCVVEPAEPIIAQIHLALDQLVPGRRGRVLEIGHIGLCAAVHRIDQHLGVGRAGALDPPVEEVGGDGADRPLRLANVASLLGEFGQLARIEAVLPLKPIIEQLHPPLV